MVGSPNGRGGWTPLRPLRGLQETRVAPGLEAQFPSRRREERGCGPVTGKDRASCQSGGASALRPGAIASAGTLRSESETQRKPEVPASPRGEALFRCARPSGVPRGPATAQGAPRDPRRDSRGERSPWLPLETRPDSPGEPGMQPRDRSLVPRLLP